MTVYVRFVEPAVDDLFRLEKQDPQLVREALKKCLLLERSATAGEPLLGVLIGLRKLTLGDRHRRLVWRVRVEQGDTIVEIAEVFAVGWREDSAVYAEVERRLKQLGDDPRAIPLAEVIEMLGKHAAGIEGPIEPTAAELVPDWIRNGLLNSGATPGDIAAMNPDEALAELQNRWSGPQH